MVAFCAPVYAVGMAVLLLFNNTFGIWKVPYFFEALPSYSIPGFFFTTKRALGRIEPYTTPDIPVLQALALWAGLLIVVMSIVVDVALTALDPRVRTSQAT